MIEVVGSYEMSVPPNAFYFIFGVRSEGSNQVVQTQQLVNKHIAEIMEALEQVGVMSTQLETVSYSMTPEYDYSDGKSRLKGTSVEHLVKLTSDNLGEIGRYIDTVIASGANVVNSLQYMLKDEEKYYEQALIEAMNNGKNKAQLIATQLGIILNPIPVRVIEGTSNMYGTTMKTLTQNTVILPGIVHVVANVQLRFEERNV